VDRDVTELVLPGGAPHPDGLVSIDTPVGFELAGVTKRAAVQLMASRVWGRFNPNHWDPVYARETGLSLPIQTGEMSSAYIAEMCVYNFGRFFFTGAQVNCKYISSISAGEVVTAHGVISDATRTERGTRFTVDVWVDNDSGEKKTVGVVTVDVTAEGATK